MLPARANHVVGRTRLLNVNVSSVVILQAGKKAPPQKAAFPAQKDDDEDDDDDDLDDEDDMGLEDSDLSEGKFML